MIEMIEVLSFVGGAVGGAVGGWIIAELIIRLWLKPRDLKRDIEREKWWKELQKTSKKTNELFKKRIAEYRLTGIEEDGGSPQISTLLEYEKLGLLEDRGDATSLQ